MIRSLKAEFLKLATIRSTYIFLGVCSAILVFFAFYIEGYRQTANVVNPNLLASAVSSAVNALAIFIALVSVLLVTHEYRYNTIMYTLTASNSRLKILVAKVLAASCFAVLATLFFGALSPVLTYLGLEAKGLSMVAQNIPYLDLLWRAAFFGWAFTMLALIFSFIIRSQVGAIVFLLIMSTTGEFFLSLLLKHNATYLPFTALNQVIGSPGMPGITPLSHGKAALVVLAYVVIGWIIAAVLFTRRDAN